MHRKSKVPILKVRGLISTRNNLVSPEASILYTTIIKYKAYSKILTRKTFQNRGFLFSISVKLFFL